MIKLAILARVQAKPGKENDVEKFLNDAIDLAHGEDQTIHWFAFKIDHATFGVFDTFESEAGREAHLHGKIASALAANVSLLLTSAPVLEKVTVLASK